VTTSRRAWARTIAWGIPSLLIVAALVAWELIVRLSDTPRWFLPPPSAILSTLFDDRRLMLHHTWVTLEELLLGFAISVVLGIAFALAIASSRIVERAFYPFVVASQAIPIIALAPILLIWFGYGLTPKVIVVVLICFFPIVVNTVDGLRSVDPELVDLLRSMGASEWTIYRVVRVPSSLPYIFSGTRIAAAVSVIGALIGEWVGASAGLGYLMTRSAAQFLTARVFAAVLISAVIGLAMFGVVALLERLFLPWQHLGSTDE
jgi:ABC-type nitrate/sulfonate/bicarbonate transport system permease component